MPQIRFLRDKRRDIVRVQISTETVARRELMDSGYGQFGNIAFDAASRLVDVTIQNAAVRLAGVSQWRVMLHPRQGGVVFACRGGAETNNSLNQIIQLFDVPAADGRVDKEVQVITFLFDAGGQIHGFIVWQPARFLPPLNMAPGTAN